MLTMSGLTRVVGLLAASMTSESLVAQDLLLLDQSRQVFVSAEAMPCGGPVHDHAQATGFEPFDETVDVITNCADGGAAGRALQRSIATPLALGATGSAIAATRLVEFSFLLSVSSSSYEVQFSVDEPTTIVMFGELAASARSVEPASFSAQTRVTLRDAEETLLFEDGVFARLNDGLASRRFLQTVRLAPGTYTFEIDGDAIVTDAIPTTGRFSTSYNATLRVVK